MPGCFSRLSKKFSKKKGEQDAQTGPPPKSKPESEPKSKPVSEPNDQSKEAVAPESGQPDGVTSSNESEEQTSKDEDRWSQAINDLTEDTKKELRKLGFDDHKAGPTSISELVDTVEKKQEECQDKFWKVKAGGKEIVFREYTTSIVDWLQKAGDIAIQFAPPQASLPWGLVKNLMNIPVNESVQMGALLLTTEMVISIISRGQVYEDIYLKKIDNGPLAQVQQRLEKSLVDLYKSALTLLASAGSLLSSNTARRIIEAIVNPSRAADGLDALGKQEDALLKDVQTCEMNRSATADKRANDMLEMLQAPMARVDAGVSQLLSHVDENERIKMLEWISNVQFGDHHYDFREKRTPGTGEWLVDQKVFDSWKDQDSSGLFWLQGDPGSGKSFLTSKVIDTIMDRVSYPLKNEGLAFFYCMRDENLHSRDTPLPILQSFVRQLSTTARNPESMQTKLHEKCKEAREKGTHLRLDDCKKQILTSLDIYQKTTLVIDAMDECVPEKRHQLVEALRLFLEKSKKPVKIFISSRPDTVLENQLKCTPTVGIQANDNQRDIEKFIEKELDRLQTESTFLAEMRPVIISKLLERSQGMFQWVSLQLTRIGKSNRSSKVHKVLSSLPETLQEAYDQVWNEIESEDEADRTLIKHAFLWVSSAFKPMTSEELLGAIRVNPTKDPPSFDDEIDEQGLLSLCRNLLVIDTQLKVWRFTHLSVREYIENEKKWTLSQSHYHAASVCLSVLNNTYEKTDPDTMSNAADQPSKPANLFDLSHAFQIYMRHHWALHVQEISKTDETRLAPRLKTFLGSPEESSLQYRRWYSQVQYEFDVPSPLFGSVELSSLDIAPVSATMFSMCRFAFDSILWEWWESAEINLASTSSSGLCLLSLAALAGSKPICDLLVKRGIDVNFRQTNSDLYGSPLAAAAGEGQTEIVKYLVLEAGAAVNMQLENRNYGSALSIAAAEGHIDIVKFLVREGKADVNMQLPNGQYGNALVAACRSGDIDLFKFLVQECNADVNMYFQAGDHPSVIAAALYMSPMEVIKYLARETGADFQAPAAIERTGSLIQIAASRLRHGLHVVEFLVKEVGVNVNTPSQYGQCGSPLAAAVMFQCFDIVEYLVLKAGADVDMPLTHGPYGSALAAAAARGTTEIFMFLMQHTRASVHNQLPTGEYGSVLAAASSRMDTEILKWLIEEAEADANVLLTHGEYGSALAAAASEGYSIECLEYLIQEAGADVNKQLPHGNFGSALAAACTSWEMEKVKCLLQAGAQVNMSLQVGLFGSALATAIGYGAIPIAGYLVHEGAVDVDMPLTQGYFGSALACAAFCGRDLTMTKCLIQQANSNVNLPLKHGLFGSALAAAIVGGEIGAMKYLIEAKADVNQRLPDGKRGSALAAAASFGEKEAAECLIKAGAEVNLKLEGVPFANALQAAFADISEEERVLMELRKQSEVSLKEKKAEVAELLQLHGANV